jgi:hypothetical protein
VPGPGFSVTSRRSALVLPLRSLVHQRTIGEAMKMEE